MEQVGQYKITRLIEEGGVAAVYEGIQESLDRPVAVKVLHRKFSEDSRIVDYFNRESLIIARLIHPNIIHVIDRGLTHDNMPYFIMEYIEGTNTAHLIKEGGLTFSKKIDIVIQTCKALSYAHKNGIIHRDIKPANILIDMEGNALVADFGIAQFYDGEGAGTPGKSELLGTPSYMSPEQKLNSGSVTFASDIYSLGIVMAEMFTGKRFPKHGDLPSPLAQDVPEPLEQLIRKCVNSEPSNRPASVEVIKNQLVMLSQGAHIDKDRKTKGIGGVPAMGEIFTILDIIRETPHSTVYLIRHKDKNQLLVAKTFKSSNSGVKTARLLLSLKQDHIVSIQGVSGNADNHLVVMEYLPGGSLSDRMVMPQPWQEAFRVIRAVVQALQFAHSNRIIHGNLKPSNILFTQADGVKVGDFQMNDDRPDPVKYGWNLQELMLADILETGKILYKMIIGYDPELKDDGFIPHKQFKSLPMDIRNFMSRLLSQKAVARFQSMKQVLTIIEKIQKDEDAFDKTVISLDSAFSNTARKTLDAVSSEENQTKLIAALSILLFILVGAIVYIAFH